MEKTEHYLSAGCPCESIPKIWPGIPGLLGDGASFESMGPPLLFATWPDSSYTNADRVVCAACFHRNFPWRWRVSLSLSPIGNIPAPAKLFRDCGVDILA